MLIMNFGLPFLMMIGNLIEQFFQTHFRPLEDDHLLGHVQCTQAPRFDHSIQDLRDCSSALKMIPTGRLYVHPEPHRLGSPARLSLYKYPPMLPKPLPNATERSYLFPAAFHSGSCLILVAATSRSLFPLNQYRGPRDAATAFYFIIWPNVRSLATRIIRGCNIHSRAEDVGFVNTISTLDNGKYEYSYRVMVTGVPSLKFEFHELPEQAHDYPFPGEGWRVRFDIPYGYENFYNL
jgi:hypothetical protein